MGTPVRHFYAALALAIAAALIGCGADTAPGHGEPQVLAALPEPSVQYSFFRPGTEQELMGVYGEGERAGLAIANYGYMVAKTRADFSPAAFAKHGLEVLSSFPANGGRYWYLHKESDLVETMERARNMGGLLYIEPDIMSYATAGIDYSNPDTAVANEEQYGVLTTLTKKAWEEYGFGPNRPVVADVDTGIRWPHEDLANVVTNAFSWFGPTQGSGLLADIGSLTPQGDPDPPDRKVTNPGQANGSDYNGHGTHTAGTIAAEGNNGKGVAGMCWNVRLVSYKGLSDGGGGASWSVYGSLWHLARWKKTNYPHTIPANYSLGSGQLGQFAADMVEMALEHGIVPICAAGNDRSGIPSWPGSLTGCIRVGAVNQLDRLDEVNADSNWGRDLSVVAPGADVRSTSVSSNTAYVNYSGTSMACPHVTGLVGYMLTFAPDLKADQIKTYLERNADPMDGQKGHSIRSGWGRINTYRTIGAVIDDMNAGNPPPSDYALTPVKVTVARTNGAAVDGALVWLYNCDATGAVANYVSVQETGSSYLDFRDDPNAEIERGATTFNLLRPGHYKAVATARIYGAGGYAWMAAESYVFDVMAGAPVALTIVIGADTMAIHTYRTGNEARQGGDTVVRLYDSVAGPAMAEFDFADYETVTLARPAPGTYWIQVLPYSADHYGEYALWVGDGPAPPTPAPGTFAAPGEGGARGGITTARTEASQLIEMDGAALYGDMTDANAESGDWYRVVVR